MDTGTTLIISFFILFTGVFLLLLPAMMEIHKRWLRFMNEQVFIIFVVIVVVMALIASSWAVWLTKEEPALLLPLGIFTVLFRLISPSVLARTISDKLGAGTVKASLTDKAVIGLCTIMGGYALYVSLKKAFGGDSQGLEYESLIMTLTVIYSFSRFYLFIAWEQMKKSPVVISWVAGLMIGVAFVLMVPVVLGDDYIIIFGVAGACGWWLASTLLYMDRYRRAPRLLRALRYH